MNGFTAVGFLLHNNQAMMSQAVAALSTVQQTMEHSTKTQELERRQRDNEIDEMKRTLGRTRPLAPRAQPYQRSF